MSYSQSTHKCADFIIACAKEINKNMSIDNFNCKIANLDRVNELIVNKLDNSFFVTDVFEKKYNNEGDFFIDRKIMLIKKYTF